jgi:anti-sigma factor RsiW
MNNCANAEIRDRLPDVVNGTLSPAETAVIEEHIRGCAACGSEAAVIRGIRAVLHAAAPVVNVAAIAAALPAPTPRPLSIVGAARWLGNWKMAAAVLVLVGSGWSLTRLYRGSGPADTGRAASAAVAASMPSTNDTALALDSATRAAGDSSGSPIRLSPSTTASGEQMTVATSIGALTDSQVDALIDRIQNVRAVPLPEPAHPRPPAVLTDSIGVKDLVGGSH